MRNALALTGAGLATWKVAIRTSFDKKIYQYASLYKLNPALVKAIIKVESSFRPGVHRDEPKIKDTSYGLMQILYKTAGSMGFLGSPDPELYDIDINLNYGCKYLRYLSDKYDKLDDIIVSYNAGKPKYFKSGKYINQAYLEKVKYYYWLYIIDAIIPFAI